MWVLFLSLYLSSVGSLDSLPYPSDYFFPVNSVVRRDSLMCLFGESMLVLSILVLCELYILFGFC
jgi:hypothetical protein